MQEKFIPAFGYFTKAEDEFLKSFTEKKWGVACKPAGSLCQNEMFVSLEFREDLTIPAFIIGTMHLDEGCPDYTQIRETRNCKVIVALQNGDTTENWHTPNNWPDYFIDLISNEITQAVTQLITYEPVPEEVIA